MKKRQHNGEKPSSYQFLKNREKTVISEEFFSCPLLHKSSILSDSTESMMKFLHACDYSKLVLEEAKVILSKFITSGKYLNNIIRRTFLL